ncbi:ABC transporter permease [candidate division KSB1 bacterium]|nr:ABC transporter permease [candidate division KSB1 bacterium]
MFSNYFKIAIRSLLRGKTYTALNVLGLAIGLTCFGLIAAWAMHELSYDRFNKKHERIYRIAGNVKTDAETFDQAVTAPPMAETLKQDYPEEENAVRLDMNDCIVRYGEQQFLEDGVLLADQSFFEMFDYRLSAGDQNTALREPYSLVLTQSIAEKYFGAENPLGKIITLFLLDPSGNGAPYKITGVMPDPPQNAHFTFNMLGSFNTFETANPDARTSEWRYFWNGFYTYVLLKEGADPKAFEQKLPDYAERYLGEKMRELKMFYIFSLQPLADIHLHSRLRYEIQATSSMSTVYIFATVGVFILLIACINYMNLTTARSLGRAKEVGVKKVLGAVKPQLIRQFLVESTLVAAIALALSFIFMELLQPFFFDLTGKKIEPLFSNEMLVFLTGTTLLVGLLSGLYPAFFISMFRPAQVLKGSFKSSGAGIALRKGLVVVQFAIAIVLLVGIGVVKSQMDFIRSKNLGFNKEELLVLDVNGFSEVQNGIQPFRDDLLSQPSIKGVTISRGLIVGGLGNSHVETVDGSGKSVSTSIYQHQVGYDYLDVYGMKLVAGRNFSPQAPGDTVGGVYIVNEAAVRVLGWGDPQQALGKPFRAGNPAGTVIGVVQDFHFTTLQERIEPVAISPTRPNRFSRISVRLSTAQLAATIKFIEQAWHMHFPNALLQYSFFDERLESQYQAEKLFGKIFTVFVVLSLAIAGLGLFGLAAYAAEQRTKEIGIRKVLGASVASVIGLLSKDFVKLVLLANLLAWPLGWYAMNGWLQNFAYRIDIGWWVFALSGGLALLIALLTISVQALKAALANPVDSLRYE